MHVKQYTQKNLYLMKMSGPKIWVCLFMFRPIASKQFGFLCLIVCFVVVVFFLFCKKNTLFVTKVCNSLYNFNSFSILKILQDLWPLLGVKRYRLSIFKIKLYSGNLHYFLKFLFESKEGMGVKSRFFSLTLFVVLICFGMLLEFYTLQMTTLL